MRLNTVNLQVLFFSSLVLLAVESMAIVIGNHSGLSPLFVIGLARIIEAASFLIIIQKWGGGLASIGLDGPGIYAGLKKGFIWSLGFGFVAAVFLAVLFLFNINLQKVFIGSDSGSTLGLVLFWVVGGLFSPLAEEIFFRGVLYGFLRRWGFIFAILGSTVAFSMAHALTTGISFIQVVGSLVFAVSYDIEKNLLVPITIHVFGNIAIFILSFLLAL